MNPIFLDRKIRQLLRKRIADLPACISAPPGGQINAQIDAKYFGLTVEVGPSNRRF
jgi:hypothetical protein